jgi:CheY-like chemotaxis protein
MDNKLTVLLVDDDKFLLDMYSLKFGKSGLEVVTAVGSEEALKKLRDKFEPNIIMLDIIMPGVDGLDLLAAIRKEQLSPKSTVIMLTNQSQQIDMDRAKALKVDGYIIKASTIPSEVYDKVMEIHKNAKKD